MFQVFGATLSEILRSLRFLRMTERVIYRSRVPEIAHFDEV